MSAAEAKEFVSEVWGLQGTAYLVLALRYYARVSKSGWNSLAWDDALMFLATVRYLSSQPHPPIQHLPSLLGGHSNYRVFPLTLGLFSWSIPRSQ